MSTFFDVALRQRACRRFDSSEDVPDSDLLEMVNAAVHAPSAENRQPWEFVVVRNAPARRVFQGIVQAAWSGGGKDYVQAHTPPELFSDIQDGIEAGGLETAPVVIIVCCDFSKVDEMWAPESIYPATQNLLLAATALGYGSCLGTGVTTIGAEQIRDLLNLPDNIRPFAAVFIGRAARVLGPPRREAAASHLHRETFGSAW